MADISRWTWDSPYYVDSDGRPRGCVVFDRTADAGGYVAAAVATPPGADEIELRWEKIKGGLRTLEEARQVVEEHWAQRLR